MLLYYIVMLNNTAKILPVSRKKYYLFNEPTTHYARVWISDFVEIFDFYSYCYNKNIKSVSEI